MLVFKLAHLDDWTRARQRNAEHYTQMINAAGLDRRLQPPSRVPGCRHIFNQYVVRAEQRDALRAHLTAQGIGTEIYYPVSLHEQKCFAYLGYWPDDFPQAHRAGAETLALPIYPELTAAQGEYVVEQIAAFYRTANGSTAARKSAT